jgi:DNA primase
VALARSGQYGSILTRVVERLETLGRHPRVTDQGEIVFRCLAHDDRHASFSFNLYKGVGHCFACGWSPTRRMFYQRLGLDIPPEELDKASERPVPASKPQTWHIPPLGDRGRQYLRSRGIVEPMFSIARFGETVTGLVIPWMAEDRVLFPVMRTWSGNPKYVTAPGVNKADYLYGWHLGPTPYAVLVEGEFDAIRLRQWGYPALALGTSRLSDAQARQLPSLVWVLMDGDPPGQAGAQQVAAKAVFFSKVSVLALDENRDPADLSQAETERVLQSVDRVQSPMVG